MISPELRLLAGVEGLSAGSWRHDRFCSTFGLAAHSQLFLLANSAPRNLSWAFLIASISHHLAALICIRCFEPAFFYSFNQH
jgi:hypothetical protein